MIKINEKYYISSDIHNYMLQEKKKIQDKKSKRFGEYIYETIGYYATIDGCLNGIIKKESRDFISKDEEITIKEAINKIENIKKEILNYDKGF